tara:strand:- start:1137 stop:1343 length:207 start_codon:yes stop_codon:yes gene_type:complete
MAPLDYPYPRTAKEKEAATQAVKGTKVDKQRQAESKAPTTKTEMGKRFKKGGVIDGAASKGKTRCRVV